ncbi:hypothetical protein M9434_002956 [Picochlorum sp. BPE23]|nr:hypothetical protein M9434_002956 [Picochlorum sp. BPE23]
MQVLASRCRSRSPILDINSIQTEVNFQPKLLEYRGTHGVKGPCFLNSAKKKKQTNHGQPEAEQQHFIETSRYSQRIR